MKEGINNNVRPIMINDMINPTPTSTEAILENWLQDIHSYIASCPIIRVDPHRAIQDNYVWVTPLRERKGFIPYRSRRKAQ